MDNESFRADLKRLDSMLHNPRAYLVNYFEDMCHRIDLTCELYLQEEPTEKDKALECQSLMTRELKAAMAACVANLKMNKLEPSLVLRAESGIRKIEAEVRKIDFGRASNRYN